jgi:hypothetical protein
MGDEYLSIANSFFGKLDEETRLEIQRKQKVVSNSFVFVFGLPRLVRHGLGLGLGVRVRHGLRVRVRG